MSSYTLLNEGQNPIYFIPAIILDASKHDFFMLIQEKINPYKFQQNPKNLFYTIFHIACICIYYGARVQYWINKFAPKQCQNIPADSLAFFPILPYPLETSEHTSTCRTHFPSFLYFPIAEDHYPNSIYKTNHNKR